jgi:hypothetical protein
MAVRHGHVVMETKKERSHKLQLFKTLSCTNAREEDVISDKFKVDNITEDITA